MGHEVVKKKCWLLSIKRWLKHHGRPCVVRAGGFLLWQPPGGSRMGWLVLPVACLTTPGVRACQNLQSANHKLYEKVGYDILHNGCWSKMAATMHAVGKDFQVLVAWQTERRDFLSPYTMWPEEGRDFWGLWNMWLPAGGGASTNSWGPAPSYIRYWLSSHYLQKQCNKYKAFTHTRILNNLSFMTYPEGILANISLLLALACSFSATLVFLSHLLRISQAQ